MSRGLQRSSSNNISASRAANPSRTGRKHRVKVSTATSANPSSPLSSTMAGIVHLQQFPSDGMDDTGLWRSSESVGRGSMTRARGESSESRDGAEHKEDDDDREVVV